MLFGKSEIAGSNLTTAFKFQRNKMFLLFSLVKIQYCGEPPWPRDSRPQTVRLRISNPVSAGQCHLNYLTIHMKFSWPSLA